MQGLLNTSIRLRTHAAERNNPQQNAGRSGGFRTLFTK